MKDSSSSIIWAIIGIIIIAGLVVYAVRARGNSAATASPSTNSGLIESPLPETTESPAVSVSAATITYDSGNFSPGSTTINAGETVTFNNNSAVAIQLQSNPHPLHTDNSELNIGTIAPDQSKTATLTKTGTFGFHNHLNPSERGTITIR